MKKPKKKITAKTSGGNRTVQKKIQGKMSRVVIISLLILGLISCSMSFMSTYTTLRKSMSETSIVAAKRITWEIKAYKNIVQEMGKAIQLGGDEYSTEQKQEFIDERVKEYGFIRGKYIGADGIAQIDGTDYSDREYFKKAMAGEVYFSEPLIAKTDGSLSLISAAPVWEDGLANTKVKGVVFVSLPMDILTGIVNDIYVSKNSGAYIIDRNGTTVAHTEEGMVESQNNNIEKAKTDPSQKKIASIEQKMIAGEEGIGVYHIKAVYKFLSYAPIEGTNGWSIGIFAPFMDFMMSSLMGIVVTVLLLFISSVTSARMARKMGERIGTPVKQCAERLQLMVRGDLQTPVPQIKTDDEIEILAEATGEIVAGMNTIIEDVKYLMASMAEGDFTVVSGARESYVGDYEEILTSMRAIKRSMGGAFSSIREAAEQVSAGSEQMSESAQNLAEGATDQAGAVQQLLATVQETTGNVRDSAQTARETSDGAREIAVMAQQSIEKMQEMTAAMERITEASKKISNISATIEEIASQTNLLSLNASIEAARAGEAGKGFAVVAGEIGKLAAQSAEAAGETRNLIDTAIDEVSNGSSIVDTTAAALGQVVENISQIVNAIEKVAETSEDQAHSMGQINVGIEQISSVVETNSATAEESSATSEELSAQAIELKQAVEKFQVD